MYVFIFLVKLRLLSGQFFGKIAAHSAYDMFSWYKYLIVNLVFSNLGFWSGVLFLIAPFPDRCLLVSLICHIWYLLPFLFCVLNVLFPCWF